MNITSNQWYLMLFTLLIIGFLYMGEYVPLSISALGAVYTSNKIREEGTK